MTTTTATTCANTEPADADALERVTIIDYLAEHGWTDETVLAARPGDAGWRAGFDALPIAALWTLADRYNAAITLALIHRTGIDPDDALPAADWQRHVDALLDDAEAVQQIADQQANALAGALIEHLGPAKTARLLERPDEHTTPSPPEPKHARRRNRKR